MTKQNWSSGVVAIEGHKRQRQRSSRSSSTNIGKCGADETRFSYPGFGTWSLRNREGAEVRTRRPTS